MLLSILIWLGGEKTSRVLVSSDYERSWDNAYDAFAEVERAMNHVGHLAVLFDSVMARVPRKCRTTEGRMNTVVGLGRIEASLVKAENSIRVLRDATHHPSLKVTVDRLFARMDVHPVRFRERIRKAEDLCVSAS